MIRSRGARILVMARIVIVDREDNAIGSRERKETEGTIYRVTGIWITNSKGEILVARRALRKAKDPGKWGPAVAGTVEEGETYESNAAKELEEELGIRAPLRKGPKNFVQGKNTFFCQWFFATVDLPASAFTIQEAEVAEVKWIAPQMLLVDLAVRPHEYIPSFTRELILRLQEAGR